MIRKLSLSDDLNVVAKLIYETDDTLFPILFGTYKKAKPILLSLIQRSDNPFSHKWIHVYVEENKILGLIIFYSKKDKPSDHDFKHVMKGYPALRIGFMSLLFINILNPDIKESLYIQNLSVLKDERSKGVGTALLKGAYQEANDRSIQKVSLDVGLNNQKAMRLYLKEGFQLIKKRRLLGIIPLVYWCEKTVSY